MKSRVALLLTFIFSVCETLKVNQTQSFYKAVENHRVTLEWTFTTSRLLKYYQVYCYHHTDLRISVVFHVEQSGEYPNSQHPHFAGRVQFDEDAFREGRLRLYLSRLQTEDSGLYECVVTTDYSTSAGKCQLNVSAAEKEPETLRPGPETPGPKEPGLEGPKEPEICGRTGLFAALGLATFVLVITVAAALRKCLNKSRYSHCAYKFIYLPTLPPAAAEQTLFSCTESLSVRVTTSGVSVFNSQTALHPFQA
ncbi:uncharacterized protein V6R79_022872 [Siganus canaliculatus]